MKYLLGTCVVSELVKKKPNANVVRWIKSHDEQHFCLSALTIGEIHKGIEKISDSSRKAALYQWIEHDLKERFRNRILSIEINVATTWGQIQARAELSGKPMPAIDGLIAATGIAYNLVVVTRNVIDMEQSQVELVNPWEF